MSPLSVDDFDFFDDLDDLDALGAADEDSAVVGSCEGVSNALCASNREGVLLAAVINVVCVVGVAVIGIGSVDIDAFITPRCDGVDA